MKKILLLGGSAQQVIAIETAKKLGCYTVLCDFLTDNPGRYVADKFYLISTTDKEAVLKVAKKENVDGVLAYASDPAAPTAAYVAQELGLPGNPYKSVEILCNKDKFRKFLSDSGFAVPKSLSYHSKEDAFADIEKFDFPIIIKPVDSSGSKGATVLKKAENFEKSVEFAFEFSRCNRIIVEEFIEKKHLYLIGGDVFISDGKIIQWGLMNCHRDLKANSLVPVGKSYPAKVDEKDFQQIKATLNSLVEKLELKAGAMNVELIIDKSNKVYLIDIGPRSGGNMIPDLLSMIFDSDIVKMSICAAMGWDLDFTSNDGELFYATHNLHSLSNGKFMGIQYSSDIKKYVVKECIYKKIGDNVEFFDNAAKAIGILFLKFPNACEMNRILDNIGDHIIIKVD